MTTRLAYSRPDPRTLIGDPNFIARVMAKLDEKKDTAQIALELMTAECHVANALAFGREQRRIAQ